MPNSTDKQKAEPTKPITVVEPSPSYADVVKKGLTPKDVAPGKSFCR